MEEAKYCCAWHQTGNEGPCSSAMSSVAGAAMQDNPFTGINPVTQGPLPRRTGGRPKGFDGTRCKMPSALAQAFRRAGLDWREDFALAIRQANSSTIAPSERKWAKERIKLWLRLLPYLITTQGRGKVRKWKGKPSKAALIALETLEGKGE